jgi:hypothetical protein
MGVGFLSWGVSRRLVNFTSHLHLALSLRVSGALPLVLLYIVVVRTGTK